MKRMIQTKQLHRMLCTLLLLCAGVVPAMATSTYYYHADVEAKLTNGTTGGGKVYVTTDPQSTPSYTSTSDYTSDSQDVVGDYGQRIFYYYAQADDDYIFSHWADTRYNNTTHSPNSTDGTPFFSTDRRFTSKNSNDPTKFSTYAIFLKQNGVIKVQTSDPSKGSVAIDKLNNQYTQTVTISAFPDTQNGVKFLGWRKNGTGEYVSTSASYTLTASAETEGTYYAYFSDPAEVLYCRIKNNKTGNFLSVYGSSNKRAGYHTRTFKTSSGSRTRNDGFDFKDCLQMISPEEAQGNPATVFKLQGSPAGQGRTIGVNLSAHGASYLNYVKNDDDYELTITTSGSGISHIFAPFRLDESMSPMNSYFCDEETGWLVMKTTDGLSSDVLKSSEWTVYILDENTVEGAFGANTKAKYTKEGKDGQQYYYTTMYTDFPYKLKDGVNAYYLVFNSEFTEITDRAVFTQVEGDVVPANLAVVLECPAVQNDAKSGTVVNRLLPLPANTQSNVSVNEGDNFIKGYICLDGKKRDNDKTNMYVLSSKNGILGFYHSNNDYMSPNKAYLLVPKGLEEEAEQHAKTATFCFGLPEEEIEGVTTDIVLSDEIVNEIDDTIYDLQGRKVKNPTNGIYIRDGKKYVIK